jgi:hypothetical protein
MYTSVMAAAAAERRQELHAAARRRREKVVVRARERGRERERIGRTARP